MAGTAISVRASGKHAARPLDLTSSLHHSPFGSKGESLACLGAVDAVDSDAAFRSRESRDSSVYRARKEKRGRCLLTLLDKAMPRKGLASSFPPAKSQAEVSLIWK